MWSMRRVNDYWEADLIQSTPVRAVMGRDDAVIWPVVNAGEPLDVTGITRMLLICEKDGEDEVTLDSQMVPAAYDFTAATVVGGKLVNATEWIPGIAIGSSFTESGLWKCKVYLFDGVHAEGVYHGTFMLDVEIP